MKRNFAAVLVTTLLVNFLLSGCMQKDTTPPHIILKEPVEEYYISLNDKYIEPGFQIYDNRSDSAAMTVEIENPLDTLEEDFYSPNVGPDIYMGVGAIIEAGEFDIVYTVTDEEGNSTTVKRHVIVRNDMYKYAREYTVSKQDLTPPIATFEDYNIEIDADENVNNRIWFPRFSNLQFYNLNVYADIVGDSIYLPYQAFTDQNGYFIIGKEDDNNGYAGEFDLTNYKFTIEYEASNNTEGSQFFRESFEKF